MRLEATCIFCHGGDRTYNWDCYGWDGGYKWGCDIEDGRNIFNPSSFVFWELSTSSSSFHHPCDEQLLAWNPRKNPRSLSSPKAKKIEFVVVVILILIVIVIIFVMEDYGLEVPAKTPCLYKILKQTNLNLLLLFFLSSSSSTSSSSSW